MKFAPGSLFGLTALFGVCLSLSVKGSSASVLLADQIEDTRQFELRAPINSTPPEVQNSKPGTDNYRATAPFPKNLEKDLLKDQPQAQAGVRLESIVGANAQLTIHENEIVVGPLQGLLVDIFNGTDRPLLFDGDRAVASVNGASFSAVSLQGLELAVSPPRSSADRFARAAKHSALAGATIGAVPTVRDMKMQAGPIPQRYGADEARRVDELSRFGQRILWPGDTTSGILYFAADRPLKGASINLPVTSLFDTKDQTTLIKAR